MHLDIDGTGGGGGVMTSLQQLKRFEARISLFKSLDCPLALAAAGRDQRFTRYPPVINHNQGWCNCLGLEVLTGQVRLWSTFWPSPHLYRQWFMSSIYECNLKRGMCVYQTKMKYLCWSIYAKCNSMLILKCPSSPCTSTLGRDELMYCHY